LRRLDRIEQIYYNKPDPNPNPNPNPNSLGPEWLMHIDEMNEISRKKNIPLTLGRRWAGCDTAQNYNDVRW
jgi:hypothetical protein